LATISGALKEKVAAISRRSHGEAEAAGVPLEVAACGMGLMFRDEARAPTRPLAARLSFE
jgi:hypothetical protein